MRQQNYLTQYAQMRASGEITAEIEIASVVQAGIKEFGKDKKAEPPKMDFKDIDALLRLRPTVVLNNVGEEPIEAIRVVTNLFQIGLPTQPGDKAIFHPMLREEERDDIMLPEQWLPGKSVGISLVKGILGQMVQIQSKEKHAKHFAWMQVRVSGKITNSTVFGRGGEGRVILCLVQWTPSGFPEGKAREVLSGYQSTAVFGPRAPILIPRKGDKPGKK
jgi:hypothetical protein